MTTDTPYGCSSKTPDHFYVSDDAGRHCRTRVHVRDSSVASCAARTQPNSDRKGVSFAGLRRVLPAFASSSWVIFFFAIVMALSACGGGAIPQHPKVYSVVADQVVIVAGTHANSPRPVLSDQATEVVKAAMMSGGTVQVVHGSAHPTIDGELRLEKVTGTDAGKAALIKGNLKKINDALGRGPSSDGSDVLEAVSVGADWLRGAGAQHPVIIVADSGLTDSGRLQFTAPGMLGADPTEVASFLKSTKALPDLENLALYLVSFGYSSLPQLPLDSVARTRVIQIWEAVFKAAGATVIVDPTPNTGVPVQTAFTVKPVDLPMSPAQPPGCSPADVVFDAQSQVSFIADTDQFIDAAAAEAALRPVAEWLVADSHRTALIRGTTANDGSAPDRLQALGQRRADVVARLLRQMGVQSTQLTTVGVGSDFPEYVVPDRDTATGELLPGPAALNRSVRIGLDAHC